MLSVDNSIREEKSIEEIMSSAYYHQYVSKKYKRMIKLYEKAIELGNIEAYNNLACYHWEVTKDYDKMMEYFNEAIKHNYTESLYNLGLYYFQTKDDEKMLHYLNLASKKGSTDALYFLADYFYYKRDYDRLEETMTKIQLKEEDYHHIEHYFKQVYEEHKFEAIIYVAIFCDIVLKDKTAYKLYYLSAELGNAFAMYKYALHCRDVVKDCVNTINYLQKSMELGYEKAKKEYIKYSKYLIRCYYKTLNQKNNC